LVQIVNFDDHAVNFVHQVVSVLLKPVAAPHHVVDAHFHQRLLRSEETPTHQPVQRLDVSGERKGAIEIHQLIGQEGERSRGADAGIFLAQTPGCGVAGIGELLGAEFALTAVEFLEVGFGEEDLTAHLHPSAYAVAQRGRHVMNGADILRDVFADSPVAAGGGLRETAVYVIDGER
jgi:hypothetical protein